eukprot:scaffold11053_cov110-Isochrysis_galbana.AAC.2
MPAGAWPLQSAGGACGCGSRARERCSMGGGVSDCADGAATKRAGWGAGGRVRRRGKRGVMRRRRLRWSWA